MGVAVAQVLDVSAWVSGFDGSTVVVPALGAGALARSCVAALSSSTLPASALRWLALVPAGAGLAFAAAPRALRHLRRPGRAGAAVRARDGRLVLVGKPSAFVASNGCGPTAMRRERATTRRLREGVRCDRVGCVGRGTAGRARVAFVQTVAAFEEDCRRAAIVISRLDGARRPARPRSCSTGRRSPRRGADDAAVRSATPFSTTRRSRTTSRTQPPATTARSGAERNTAANRAADRGRGRDCRIAADATDRDPEDALSSGEPD